MKTITLTELRERYETYKHALFVLASSHQTVGKRREAIDARDEFERDVRDGMLDGLFAQSENW